MRSRLHPKVAARGVDGNAHRGNIVGNIVVELSTFFDLHATDVRWISAS